MLYTTNSSGVEGFVLTELAKTLGWEVFRAPKLSNHGIPFVKSMYMDAAERVPNCSYYTYSNGDILYSHDFIETLEEVSTVTAQLEEYRVYCNIAQSYKFVIYLLSCSKYC